MKKRYGLKQQETLEAGSSVHWPGASGSSLPSRPVERLVRSFAIIALFWGLVSQWPRIQDLLNQLGSNLRLNQHGIPELLSGPWSQIANYFVITLMAAGLLLVASVVYLLHTED